MDPLVRARSLTGFDTCVRRLGGNPDIILELVGISSHDLKDPAGWIPFKACLRAFQLASQTLRDPTFGVKVQRCRDFSFLGPLLLIAQHSQTVTTALRSISRYLAIQNTGYRTSFNIDRNECTRAYEMAPDLRAVADQFIEESLLTTRNLICVLSGQNVPAIRYAMRHKPNRPYENYLSDFGAPVLFEQNVDGVVIAREYADLPIQNRDPNIEKFVLEYLEERVLPASREVVSATRSLLEALIPIGQAQIGIVASHLNLHPRTLQRRLNDSGSCFTKLLEEKRRTMAERLLREGNLPLSNIASYLGYSEQSAFNHAFERWHGVPPSRWVGIGRTSKAAELSP